MQESSVSRASTRPPALEHWIGSIPRGTGPLDRLAFRVVRDPSIVSPSLTGVFIGVISVISVAGVCVCQSLTAPATPTAPPDST